MATIKLKWAFGGRHFGRSKEKPNLLVSFAIGYEAQLL
jgi:hypothetical protein